MERIRALRKAVLRPYLPADDPYVMADDHLPTTVAFAAVSADEEILGVARITPEPPPFAVTLEHSWRLRGMATSPEVRNMGVGSSVLARVVEHIAELGGGVLWCNARVSARGLYERGSMEQWGEGWDDPDIGPHVVMWRHIL